MRDFPLIVVAEYFGNLLGLKYIESDDVSPRLEPAFVFSEHAGMVKSLSVSPDGSMLISGSADQHVRLFDTVDMRAVGVISDHSDSVLTLAAPDVAHVISGSQDGDIRLFGRVDGTWERLLSFPGHHGAVLAVAMHPSGRLALSAGADMTLRVWDLVNGKQTIKATVPGNKYIPINTLCFSENGMLFASLQGTLIRIHSLLSDSISKAFELECDSKIVCADFIANDCLLVGAEDGTVRFIYVTENDGEAEGEGEGEGADTLVTAHELGRLPLFDNRVRALGTFMVGPNPRIFAASSDGAVVVADLGAAAGQAEAGAVINPEDVVLARFDVNGRIVRGTVCPIINMQMRRQAELQHARAETKAEQCAKERALRGDLRRKQKSEKARKDVFEIVDKTFKGKKTAPKAPKASFKGKKH